MANGSRPGSGSGDAGLRRATRDSPSKKHNDIESPGVVRKSQRLGKLTAPETPSVKRKLEKPVPSPLRRSVRENKFQSPSSRISEKGSTSKSGSKQKKNSNSNSPAPKGKDIDMSLKEIVKKANGKRNAEVGNKRKKMIDARVYKNMFPNRNKKLKVSASAKEKGQGNCGDAREKKSESNEEGGVENGDGEDVKEDATKNEDVGKGGSDSDIKTQVSIEKQCDSEIIENLRPSVTANAPMPSSETENNETEDIEVDCSTRENHDYKEEKLTSNELSNDSNCLSSSPKRRTLVAPVDGREDAQTFPNDVPLISSSCSISSLTEQCTKCFRKRRLEYNALKQELCCCLSDSTGDLSSVYKDRGEGETFLTVQCAEKHEQNVRRSEPPVVSGQDTCLICKSAGMLMHCGGKGCTNSFHASCLSAPDESVFLPMWYCCECTKKRLTLGVHSVSEGIESIWDVREVEFSNSTGVEKQKQHFVKYKGLAHCHNHWVAELHLLQEVPQLLAKFCEKKRTHWKPEWVVPHRLLKQRLLVADESDKHNDQVASILSNDQCEWLVKWGGLDYDQATWEFQDSSCFKVSDLQQLIREYETRHEKTRTPISSGNEIQERRKGSHVKAGKVLGGGVLGVESWYMHSVNKLIDNHHKKRNAVLLKEQDRIVKVVYLISSILTNICRPILVISPCESLSFWEAEFSRLAATINVVVYGGSTRSRNIIRNLEFYEGDSIMLQVLLVNPEVVSEDLDVVKGIEWEAVIVDDCQQSGVMAYSGSIKNIVTNWRLLLVNAQLKDDVAEYVNILSLLESGSNSDQNSGLMVNSSENMSVLKERLSSFISCARFLEYWVPVQISNIQLEQYCSLLLSNLTLLLSCSKTDLVGSLRDILISTRKCCDHPYLMDPSLQSLFPNQIDLLELGTQASGKLTLLDTILSEFRNQELKVLILFQSVRGSGRDTKGDILEDFLGQRFGPSSYERVDSVCQGAIKQAALNKFNKEKDRSFLLLETRACLPSIKLSSLDAVIIFDGDWNPLIDMRALQKITIDSKLEQIKVFRFYSCCTVEENVLVLSKNDTILDSTLNGISRSTSHKMLMWGSSCLFSRLDEFHNDTGDSKDNIVPGCSFLKDVSEDILSVIQNNGTENPNKYISLARQNGGCYLKSTALVGEQKIELEDGVLPHHFWMKLLEGKQPQWKFLSGASQRNRKRVKYQESEDQDNEATKKNRKTDRTKVDSSLPHIATNMEKSYAERKEFQDHFGTATENNLDSTTNAKLSSHTIADTNSIIRVNDIPGGVADERKNLYTEQWGLLQMLKPSISRLCETLQLTDDSKRFAEQFLEYVLKNHRVVAEPEAILQAFQISVCWSAVDALGQKIDHKKSLDFARECMNFNCGEEEAEAIYSKTKMFMKIFVRRLEGFRISDSSNNPGSANNGIIRDSKERGIEFEGSSALDGFDKPAQTFGLNTDSRNDNLRYIRKVKKKCDKLLERLKDKQREELDKFERECEDKRAELEKKYKMESTIILSIHGKTATGVSKLKIVDRNCAKEKEDLELQISTCLRELEARLEVERDEQNKKTAKCLDQVKSLAPNELLYNGASDNDTQLQAAECIVLENSYVSAKHNSDSEKTGIPGPNLRPVASRASKPQENTTTSAIPCPEKERENHHIDGSIKSSKVVLSCQEDGLISMPKEVSCQVDLPKTQEMSISESVLERVGPEGPLEQFPAASTRETDNENRQMESVEVDRSTVLETNQVHEGNATLATDPLCSPGISLTKQPTTDPALETALFGSQLGYQSCQVLAGGVDEEAQNVTGIHNVLPQGGTELLSCSNPMRSNLVPSAGLHGLSSTENSRSESLITPHTHDQTRIAPGSRLGDQLREDHTVAQGTQASLELERHINELGQTISRAMPESVVNPNVNANLGQFETTSTRGNSLPRGSHPNSQLPIYTNLRSSDPLQNELERIQKEIDEVINRHEETQLQLKSDCDKEIEEIVAQIRKKYAEKHEAAAASSLLQRKELEVNKKKVLMHKILAEAFRSKCMDYKAASGMQQGISSGSVDHASQIQRSTATPPSSTFGLRSSQIPHNGTPAPRVIYPSSALSPSPAARVPHVVPLGPTPGHLVRNSLPVPPRPSSLTLNSQNASHQTRSVASTSIVTPMEIAVQNENSASNLPDSVQNSASQHIPRFDPTPNLHMPSSSLGAGKDVVCLSDDE